VRSCPSCQIGLETTEETGVELDVCPKCAGVWFDDGELRRLSEPDRLALIRIDEKFVAPLEKSSTEGVKPCPSCKTTMEEFRYLYDSPVVLDSCPTCFGIWVENGELKAMVAAHDAQENQAINESMARTIAHQNAMAELEVEAAEREVRHSLFRKVMGFFSIRRPYTF
jgi:Zn-finger nucleic acid-binding protein